MLLGPTSHCCNELELKLYNDAKKLQGKMAGNYTKMSEKINGHDAWKNDAYNYNKFVISFDSNIWTIGTPLKSAGIQVSSDISCPSLIGNKWKYTSGDSKSMEGGDDITLKCLG